MHGRASIQYNCFNVNASNKFLHRSFTSRIDLCFGITHLLLYSCYCHKYGDIGNNEWDNYLFCFTSFTCGFNVEYFKWKYYGNTFGNKLSDILYNYCR